VFVVKHLITVPVFLSLFQVKQAPDFDLINMERKELQMKLMEKERAEQEQQEKINRLTALISVSTILPGMDEDDSVAMKNRIKRRETWCPGKGASRRHAPRPIVRRQFRSHGSRSNSSSDMYPEEEGEEEGGEENLSVVEEECEERRRLTDEFSAMHVTLIDHNVITPPRMMESREIQTDPWCVPPAVVFDCVDVHVQTDAVQTDRVVQDCFVPKDTLKDSYVQTYSSVETDKVLDGYTQTDAPPGHYETSAIAGLSSNSGDDQWLDMLENLQRDITLKDEEIRVLNERFAARDMSPPDGATITTYDTDVVDQLRSENEELRRTNDNLMSDNREIGEISDRLIEDVARLGRRLAETEKHSSCTAVRCDASGEAVTVATALEENVAELERQLRKQTLEYKQLEKEYVELREFTQYEKEFREMSFTEKMQETHVDLIQRIQELEQELEEAQEFTQYLPTPAGGTVEQGVKISAREVADIEGEETNWISSPLVC